ncbi:zinc finger CCCH domain-containing protein 30-like isoform X1 [Salvia divinorum]|uniref:Zinc finger CCCH domain-containing protein 30-like isoform X1 n=1 Tax=Salvia divinorum TaxID=28513 RepID=A0ABD1FYD9_SALDI
MDQAKSQLLSARVQTKPKPSYSNAVRLKNHLAWYVPLNKKQLERKSTHIPQIKWKCPPKFALNTSWHVASGEESQEAEPQKCRESAVLEAVYTDLTALPPCPVNSLLVEGNCRDDNETPIIPIIPVEEVAEMPYDTSATVNTSTNQQPSASCPLVSDDLPASRSDPSECQDQSVHGKSLPQIPHGLESGDLEIAAAAAATAAAVMPSKDHLDAELLIKFLSNPEMTKTLMKGNGWTSKPEDEAPPAPKAITSLFLPSSTPASVVDKHPNWRNEPVSKVVLSSSTKEPVNQSLILPCSKVETKTNKAASKPSGMCDVHGPTHTSQAAKRLSQSPRFFPDGPTKKVTACSHAREPMVRPLVPSTLRPDGKNIDRLVKKYGAPDITAVKPADSTMVKLEAMKKMIHDYGAPDVARVKPMVSLVAPNAMPPNIGEVHRKPFMGPISPPFLTLPPVTNLHAFPIDATGNFRPSFTPMTMPACGADLQYHMSFIKQHGEIQETGKANVPKICQSGYYLQGLERAHKITKTETNQKYRKPCIYFTSSTGCRNGFNCLFQHDVPGQWRATGAVEAPINPVAMAPVPKRMKLNEQFGKWHYF